MARLQFVAFLVAISTVLVVFPLKAEASASPSHSRQATLLVHGQTLHAVTPQLSPRLAAEEARETEVSYTPSSPSDVLSLDRAFLSSSVPMSVNFENADLLQAFLFERMPHALFNLPPPRA